MNQSKIFLTIMNLDQIVLLLVGRTGNGKSSTGNSILRKEVFTSHGFWEQTLVETPVKHSAGLLTVVDGSGIGDTRNDLIGGESAAIASCDSAFELCGKIFTAIILVLNIGLRFAKQEKDAIQMIKFLFGEDVLKKWGIIVMTYGDIFEMDNFKKDNLDKDNQEEDTTEPFQSWCSEQVGDFKTVYDECNKRCVLFDNITQNTSIKENQFKWLQFVLQNLESGPYTNDHYSKAVSKRPTQNNAPIYDPMKAATRYIKCRFGHYDEILAGLKKLIRQQKDEKVAYEINVLIQKLRMTQGLCERLCASLDLVCLFVFYHCLRIVAWLGYGKIEPLHSD